MNSAFRIIMELLITFPSAMDGLRSFLEASTIHGLVYISTTKKFIKIFWILVVTLGFTVACYMIREAFIKKSSYLATMENYGKYYFLWSPEV